MLYRYTGWNRYGTGWNIFDLYSFFGILFRTYLTFSGTFNTEFLG